MIKPDRTNPAVAAPRPLAAAAGDSPPASAELSAVGLHIPSGLIDGGEIVLMAIKPSMWRPLFDSAAWLVTSVLLAAVVAWLGHPLPGLSMAMTVQLFLAVGAARLGLSIIRWIPRWHLLTNRRVIDIRGVRQPRVSALLLLNIRNTYISASPLERLLGIGTISMVTERENDVPRVWRWVASPQLVHDRIRRAIQDVLDS